MPLQIRPPGECVLLVRERAAWAGGGQFEDNFGAFDRQIVLVADFDNGECRRTVGDAVDGASTFQNQNA